MKVIKVSQLLPENEAQRFIDRFQYIEPSCFTLATGIVQIYKNCLDDWIFGNFGALYFLVDNDTDCYYLKLYSLKQALPIWQHGIYQNFVYTCSNSFFHMFEGEDAIYGLNFCDIQEAYTFEVGINQHIMCSQPLPIHNNVFKLFWDWLPAISFGGTPCMKIGEPTNIKHVTHVGLDCIFGEEANREIVDEIRKILKLHTNVSADVYDDPDMPDYVNFIACELRKYNNKEMRYAHVSTVSSTYSIQPPPISWSLENELRSISSMFLYDSSSNKEHTESTNNDGTYKRLSFANAIATAIANRNVAMPNEYKIEDDSSFSFDSD